MKIEEIMSELEILGSEQIKKIYMNHGAREPVFGVTTKALKPLAKRLKKNHSLAMALYATGNYDAAYLAGMIADPAGMCEQDFEEWIIRAYCPMMSEYVVAVVLAETPFAQTVADRWIDSGRDLYMSAGWSCYCRLLSSCPDSEFDYNKLKFMLELVTASIHKQPNRTKYTMNDFIITVGISYLPLHREAIKAAEKIGQVEVDQGATSCKTPLASAYIQKAIEKGRLGYKRKNVRC